MKLSIIDKDILLTLSQFGYTNQRTLMDQSGYSIGSVNKSINILIQENMLDDSMALTKKAKDFIKASSPKNAIILAAVEAARVYILPRGCIEHYYVMNDIQFMPVPGKDRLFHAELDHIMSSKPKTVRKDYGELISILEKALARV